MTRNTQANGILSAGHDIRHFVAALEDQGQRPRPECARQGERLLGMLRAHIELLGVGQMHDQRMVGGPALAAKILAAACGLSASAPRP